jgi:hypothetical protein
MTTVAYSNVVSAQGGKVHAGGPSPAWSKRKCFPACRTGDAEFKQSGFYRTTSYQPTLDPITCNTCRKRLGWAPLPGKRASHKVAVTRALQGIGLRPGRDFKVSVRYYPASEYSGLRVVSHADVSFYTDAARRTAADNAAQIIQACWEKANGRRGFHLYAKEVDGVLRVELTGDDLTDYVYLGYTRVASWWDIPNHSEQMYDVEA